MDNVSFKCSHCGATYPNPVGRCSSCGVNLIPDNSTRAYLNNIEEQRRKAEERASNLRARWYLPRKSKKVAVILWFLSYGGFLQIYNFYLGFYKAALLKLVPGLALFIFMTQRNLFATELIAENALLVAGGSLIIVIALISNIMDITRIFAIGQFKENAR